MLHFFTEFSPLAKPPYETDSGMFHYMLELHDQEQLLSQIEMKHSNIIARLCYCIYHSDYPMKLGESHQFMSFSKYKILHEDNLTVGEVTTQARLHQGYLNSSIMRIIHEIHGLVTPYSLDIIFQEERLSNIYQAFSPQEYNVLKNNLGLATVNKDLDLERAMKIIQRYKEATCPCHNHAVRRGGSNWRLRPSTMVPREALLQLPTTSDSIILLRRGAKNQDMGHTSTMAQASLASSTSSDDRDIIIVPSDNELPCLTEAEEQFNT